MILIWDRKEFFSGNPMQKFGEIRDILSCNHIKYDYKVLNHNSSADRSKINTERLNLRERSYWRGSRHDIIMLSI